jgi:hypothetical protein
MTMSRVRRVAKKMPGPKCLFRGKTRQSLTLQLTPDGKALEERVFAKTGLSRGDLYELLLTKYGKTLKAEDLVPAA